MAMTVPGLVPDVAPTTSGTPNIDIPVPVDAFGGAVGHALEGLGSAVEQGSDRIWSRAMEIQDMNNRSEADTAVTKYMETVGKIHADFSALQGADAQQAFPKYIKDLQDARTGLRGTLTNPTVQRMFDSESLSTMGRTIFNGAGHAAEAAKMAAINSLTNRIKATTDLAATSDNPADVDAAKHRLSGLSFQLNTLRGTTDQSTIEETEKTINSSLDFNVIKNTAKKDPWAAEKMLNERRSGMTAADFDHAQDIVLTQQRSIGSVNIANSVMADNKDETGKPEASLEDLESQVRAKAKKLAPDDPATEQHAIQALHGLWNQKRYADRQFKYDNLDTVNNAIQNGVRDIQELRANPEVAAAIDNLPPQEQMKIPGKINAYNAARDKVMNETSMTRIAGLRNNDVESFLNLDPTDPKLGLNQVQQRTVMGWQREDKKRQNDDPRVSRALGWMRGAFGSQLQALGVYNRTKDNTEDYDHMTGTLQNALDVWQQAHGGSPATYHDVIEKIGPQVLQQRSTPTWFGLSSTKTPFYTQEVPEDFTKGYKASVNPNATDEEIYKGYTRMLLKSLYNKPQASDGAR